MRVLVDTCVLSETVRKKPNPNVLAWFGAQRESDLYLSVLTLGELYKGISRHEDGVRRAALVDWLKEQLEPRFGKRLLSVDGEVARVWGALQGQALRQGRPVAVIDSLLAATAKVHALTVATRNVADFEPLDVPVFNPF